MSVIDSTSSVDCGNQWYIDGGRVAASQIPGWVVSGYGHSTAMQVRSRGVRGLAMHIERLVEGDRRLFGLVDDGRVRKIVLALVNAVEDATLQLWSLCTDQDAVALVACVSQPRSPRAGDVTLQTAVYTRPLSEMKHTDTFAKRVLTHEAIRRGFDGVALMTDGCVTETATANICLVEAKSIVWPTGPQLRGITMKLLRASAASSGVETLDQQVSVDRLVDADSAFIVNSRGISAIHSIDGRSLRVDYRARSIVSHLWQRIEFERTESK